MNFPLHPVVEDAFSDLIQVSTINGLGVCKDKYRSKYVVVRLNGRGKAVVRLATRSTRAAAERFAESAS